jgi:hypothetical protein
MKVFCLGAAGRISRESALDLVQYSDFDKIVPSETTMRKKRAKMWPSG